LTQNWSRPAASSDILLAVMGLQLFQKGVQEWDKKKTFCGGVLIHADRFFPNFGRCSRHFIPLVNPIPK
jgi:hypothetical protein